MTVRSEAPALIVCPIEVVPPPLSLTDPPPRANSEFSARILAESRAVTPDLKSVVREHFTLSKVVFKFPVKELSNAKL